MLMAPPPGGASTSLSQRGKEGRPGGINIFGRGFGNYSQDIKMRLHLSGVSAPPRVAP